LIIPLEVTHTSDMECTVTFDVNTSGNIILTIGGVSTAVTTKSASYNITDQDNLILVDAVATMTLPDPTGMQGKIFHIKSIADNGVAVTVDTTTAATIDGEDSKTIIAKYTTLSVFTDGVNYFII
jgi:hypothetical protein